MGWWPFTRALAKATLPDSAAVHAKELAFVRARRASAQLGPPADDKVGVSLSGGGIRSAAFSIGVLQRLHARGVLPYVDFLSMVSGGAFAGMAMVSQLEATGAFPFERRPSGRDSYFLRHLRRKASYLAPLGFGSTAGRELVLTFLFGMVVNLLRLCATMACVLAAACFVIGWLPLEWVALATALVFLGTIFLRRLLSVAGGTPIPVELRARRDRQRTNLRHAGYLLVVFVPLLLFHHRIGAVVAHGNVSVTVAAILAVIPAVNLPVAGAALAWLMRHGAGEHRRSWILVQSFALALLTMLPVAGFLLFLLVRGWVAGAHWLDPGRAPWMLGALSAALICGGAVATLLLVFVVDRWLAAGVVSLHDIYRDRINDAFIVKEVVKGDSEVAFVTNADLPLARLGRDDAPTWPYPILNATMNYSRTDESDQSLRRAARFVLTPLYCGSHETRYAPTDQVDGGLQTATAIAISAAAISPRMGAYSAGLLPFLVGFFNLRLGKVVWSPRYLAAHEHTGTARPYVAFAELWSWRRYAQDSTRCYLTDGGHSENLGLLALLSRRCRLVVVVDAERDPAFEFHGLATAVRLARVDLGAVIEIDVEPMRPVAGVSPRGWAIGQIHYAGQEPGTLLYIKASLTAGAAVELAAQRAREPSFPHESTVNQFFDEARFEAYRLLGETCAEGALTQLAQTGLPDELTALLTALRAGAAPPTQASAAHAPPP